MLVEELNLQKTCIILPSAKVKYNLQLLRGRNLPLHTGVIEGIAVAKRQPAICQRHGGIDWRIEIPTSELSKSVYTKLATVCMAMCLRLNGHRDVGHPHVFLVHGVGNPKVGILGHTIALLNATHILRTIRLVVATIAHCGHFALNEVQRSIVQTILREADAQWPAIF